MTDSEKLDLIIGEMQKLNNRVGGIETEVKSLKTEVNDLKTEVKSLKTEVNDLKTEVKSLKTEVKDLNYRVTNIETDISDLKTDIRDMRTDVRSTKLIMENELRINIQRVAEGHLDLSRNLHEAMKPSNEVEMLSIKVRMLESDVMELKRKLA